MVCSEMTECGKSEQISASCYYLLVVKLVVKRGVFTTKDFYISTGTYSLNMSHNSSEVLSLDSSNLITYSM